MLEWGRGPCDFSRCYRHFNGLVMGLPAWVNHDHNPNYIMKNTIIALAASAIALSSANAQNVNITNVTSDFAPSGGSLLNLIDGDTSGGNIVTWNAGATQNTVLPTLTFSFDQAYDVDSFTIFNNGGSNLVDPQGFRDITLEFLNSTGALVSSVDINDISQNGISGEQFALAGLSGITGVRLVSLDSHFSNVASADFVAREISFGGTTTVVPEPSSALLLGLGAFGLFGRRKRS